MAAKIDGIQILIQRRPTSLTNRHPNLPVLLKIATTLQVTSCECECKSRFSVTRRLRTWLRAPFTTRPFSLLTELTFTVESKLTTEGTVKILLAFHSRKLDVSNLVFD